MSMPKLSIRDIDLTNKRVFIRVDFNVPLTEDGSTITDDTRIVATLPTIEYALRQSGQSDSGLAPGPPQGQTESEVLAAARGGPAARTARQELGDGVNVAFSPDCVGEIAERMARQLESGQVLLLENLRYHAEEEANDPAFSKALASLAEVYVNDAFGSAHRAHASTEGITHYLKPAVAGLLMEKEITYLGKALEVAGKAIRGHHRRLKDLGQDRRHRQPARQSGHAGHRWRHGLHLSSARLASPPASLVEEDKIDMAKAALDKAKAKGVKLLLPVDNVIWPTTLLTTPRRRCGIASKDFPEDWQGLDIGPKSIAAIEHVVSTAKTIVWNGPAGVFEFPRFAVGTNAIAGPWRQTAAISIIGGGDSVSAINQAGVADQITHISTGGGASAGVS
jgi:phosphoglycerate kinase